MRTRSYGRTPSARRGLRRRGVALVMVLLMVTALGGLATASIFLMSNSDLFTRAAVKEANLRNAADAGLEIARSRIDRRGSAVSAALETLYVNAPVEDASGQPIPGVKVNVYAGQSGSSTGQFGTFLSLVAEAKDSRGNSFVRRSELTQESFAKFAYWTDLEKSSSGSTIYFGLGDQIRGPLWTNDVISIISGTPRAKFWEEVRTAKTISGASYADFVKGYKINQPPMKLPPNSALARLATYAADAGYSFTAPNNSNETGVMMRIEFIAANMNPPPAVGFDNDSTDAAEGFFRVFTAATGRTAALRVDLPASPSASNVEQCGDWHYDQTAAVNPGRKLKFYPAIVHNTAWFKAILTATTGSSSHATATLGTIMAGAGSRCYSAGDAHLVAIERQLAQYPLATDREKGGEDSTFTPVGKNGSWRQFTPTPAAIVTAARPYDDRYLHPLFRGLNPGLKGVIHVKGTVAVSGVLRGRVTLYTENGHIVILDDVRYATDPALGLCADILGLIAAMDVVVADNAIATPPEIGPERAFDDTKDMFIHAVVMALKESFRVQNYNLGETDLADCEGRVNGRGCLYLTGGLIQVRRGAVGTTTGHGYIKRYSYDRCAADSPPPYFPVTGKYMENAYLEVEPVGFNVVSLFKKISPSQ